MIETSGHLPECNQRETVWQKAHYSGVECICAALRACEQRSYTLGIEVGKHDGWVAGHAAGVQAAHDAVAAINPFHMQSLVHDKRYEAVVRSEALAAIDALQEEQK